ncbi:hypothetical protein [Nocardioides ultimimeridianus]
MTTPLTLIEGLIAEAQKAADRVKAQRDERAARAASQDSAYAALGALLGAPEPESRPTAAEPVSASQSAAETAPEPIDWTETDARVVATKATAETPTPDPAPAASSEPGTDAALLAMLNPATEEN